MKGRANIAPCGPEPCSLLLSQHACCVIQQCAFPLVAEVPSAIGLCGIVCWRNPAVIAEAVEGPESIDSSSNPSQGSRPSSNSPLPPPPSNSNSSSPSPEQPKKPSNTEEIIRLKSEIARAQEQLDKAIAQRTSS